jgi:hypothetical protein
VRTLVYPRSTVATGLVDLFQSRLCPRRQERTNDNTKVPDISTVDSPLIISSSIPEDFDAVCMS